MSTFGNLFTNHRVYSIMAENVNYGTSPSTPGPPNGPNPITLGYFPVAPKSTANVTTNMREKSATCTAWGHFDVDLGLLVSIVSAAVHQLEALTSIAFHESPYFLLIRQQSRRLKELSHCPCRALEGHETGGRGVLVVGRMLVSLARPGADNYPLFIMLMHLASKVCTGPISAFHQ